jgi:hypothetical protein
VSRRRRTSTRGVLMVVFLGCLLAAAAYGIRQYRPIPSSTQDSARLAEIRSLEPLRRGRIRTHVLDLSGTKARAEAGVPDTIRYSLQAPAWHVEDAEIRGFLTGDMKYDFNQGTAYHMRVGRRFAGPFDGLYELKRGLARWSLPTFPPGARVLAAAVSFWVQGHDQKSPLAKKDVPALHLYAYPVRDTWVEGRGGRKRDSFSPASPGEVTWKDARSGEEPWPSPGGLELRGNGYADPPLAAATVTVGDRLVTLGSPELAAHVAQRASEGKTLDLMLKLDDDGEDRRGTEIGIMTSEFGDLHEARPKRPRLDLVVVAPGRNLGGTEWFTIEPGQDRVLPPTAHPGRTVLLAAEIEASDGEVEPGISVRGGTGAPGEDSTWNALVAPVERRWDWSQFRIQSPSHRVALGDSVTIQLREFWVRPGPRNRQLPELALVAPSGDLHRQAFRPVDGEVYRISFRPEEPGLWRYGWSFRTIATQPAGAHRGEGVFQVMLPGVGATSEMASFREWGNRLIEDLGKKRLSDRSAQVRVNALCRWAAAYGPRASAAERTEMDRVVREARARLSR